MDMVNCLATVGSRINDRAVPLGETLCARDLCGSPMKVAQQFPLILFRMCDGGNMLSGYYKNMHGCLRLNICKGVAMLILIDGFGRDASIHDLAKDATHGQEFTGANYG